MTRVITGLSTSLDGFVAGAEDTPSQPMGEGGDRLFQWFRDGDTPSRFYDWMRMWPASAEVFDDMAGRVGAVVAGRHTYDVANGWGGTGPLPGVPLFVVTHRVPADPPTGDVPYTFVTDGVEDAVAQARRACCGQDVSLMGTSIVQQCLRAGLLDELTIDLVPVILGRGARLLDGLEPGIELEVVRVVDAPGVTHLTYRVVRPKSPAVD